MVVKFDLAVEGSGLLRHYFFGVSRGNRIFLKQGLEIVSRNNANTDSLLMLYKPDKW